MGDSTDGAWTGRMKTSNSVPGEKNLFNEFHSRNAAPNHPPFYTLKQHVEYVERKLSAMKRAVKGNPAAEPLHEVRVTDKLEENDEDDTQETEPPIINRQNLVIIPQDPGPASRTRIAKARDQHGR